MKYRVYIDLSCEETSGMDWTCVRTDCKSQILTVLNYIEIERNVDTCTPMAGHVPMSYWRRDGSKHRSTKLIDGQAIWNVCTQIWCEVNDFQKLRLETFLLRIKVILCALQGAQAKAHMHKIAHIGVVLVPAYIRMRADPCQSVSCARMHVSKSCASSWNDKDIAFENTQMCVLSHAHAHTHAHMCTHMQTRLLAHKRANTLFCAHNLCLCAGKTDTSSEKAAIGSLLHLFTFIFSPSSQVHTRKTQTHGRTHTHTPCVSSCKQDLHRQSAERDAAASALMFRQSLWNADMHVEHPIVTCWRRMQGKDQLTSSRNTTWLSGMPCKT